jgi:hypothetical protein
MASEEACVENFRSLKRRKHPFPIDESGIMLNLSSPKPASFCRRPCRYINKKDQKKKKAFSKNVYALVL